MPLLEAPRSQCALADSPHSATDTFLPDWLDTAIYALLEDVPDDEFDFEVRSPKGLQDSFPPRSAT